LGFKGSWNYGKYEFAGKAYYSRGDYTNISSPGYGITGRINFSQRLFLQGEISYLRKISESDYVNTHISDSSVYSKVKIDLTYLDLPVYLGYTFLTEKVKPFLGAGVNMGFLLTGGVENDPVKLSPTEDGIPGIYFDNFDFGLVAIAGVDIGLKNSSLFSVFVKYARTTSTYILYRDSDFSGGYGSGSFDLNTSRMEFALAYMFSVSGKK
jgi:hypothetical protein